jgi:hypothetical protein
MKGARTMPKIEATIKVSELEEFQTLINELVESYRELPVNVKNALNTFGIRSSEFCQSKDQIEGMFAEPTGHFDLYLKKESGVVFPCDKDGRRLSNMITGQLIQGVDEVSTMSVKFYPCGWVE